MPQDNPPLLDKTMNTTEQTPRNLADVLASGLANIANNVKPDGSDISIDVPGMSANNVNDGFSELKGTLDYKIVAEAKQVSYSLTANERKNLTLDYTKAGYSPIAATITGTGSTDVIVRMVSFGFNVVSVINLSSSAVTGNIDMVVVYKKNS